MELLLNNKRLWWNKPGEPHKPIMMICYTNHALDQFLEYCIDECQLNAGIVRVGGRCKSQKLEPFLLANVKRAQKVKKSVDGDIFHRIRDQFSMLDNIKVNNIFTCAFFCYIFVNFESIDLNFKRQKRLT